MCVSTAGGVSLQARGVSPGYSCEGVLAPPFYSLNLEVYQVEQQEMLDNSITSYRITPKLSQPAGSALGRQMQQRFRPYHHWKSNTSPKCLLIFHRQVPFELVQGPWKHYLTKRTVSLQKDSSQLGPGTTSAHSGNRWWGRVTLSVNRNSKSAAVTNVSSRITQEDVKSGVNLSGKADRAGVILSLLGLISLSEVTLIPKNTK